MVSTLTISIIVSDLASNNEPLYLNIPSINNKYDLYSLLISKKTIDITLPKTVCFTIMKNEKLIASSLFTICKGSQWLQFNYQNKKKAINNFINCIKVKIKCTFTPLLRQKQNKSNSKIPLIKESFKINNNMINKDMHNRSYECAINFDDYFNEIKEDDQTTTSTTRKNNFNMNITPTFTSYNNYNKNIHRNHIKEHQLTKGKNCSLTKTSNTDRKSKLNIKAPPVLTKKHMNSKLMELTINNNSSTIIDSYSNHKSLNTSTFPKQKDSVNTSYNITSKKKDFKHIKINSIVSFNKEENNITKNTSLNTFAENGIVSPSINNQSNNKCIIFSPKCNETYTNNKNVQHNESKLHTSFSEELIKITNIHNKHNNNIFTLSNTLSNTNNHIKSSSNIEQDPLEIFTQIKNDFHLLYTNDYLQNISNDLLKLELELLIEKIFEIITCYHFQLESSKFIYNKINLLYNKYSSKYMKLNHKLIELQYKKEQLNKSKRNINKQIQSECDINKSEFMLFNKFIGNKHKIQNDKQNKLKNILSKVLYDNGNYNIVYNDLNEHARKFINLNLSNNKKENASIYNKVNTYKNKGISDINNSMVHKVKKNKINNSLSAQNKLNLTIGYGKLSKEGIGVDNSKKKVMNLKKNTKRKI